MGLHRVDFQGSLRPTVTTKTDIDHKLVGEQENTRSFAPTSPFREDLLAFLDGFHADQKGPQLVEQLFASFANRDAAAETVRGVLEPGGGGGRTAGGDRFRQAHEHNMYSVAIRRIINPWPASYSDDGAFRTQKPAQGEVPLQRAAVCGVHRPEAALRQAPAGLDQPGQGRMICCSSIFVVVF